MPCEDTDTQGEDHVETEAETGLIKLQAKESLGLPEPGGGRKEPLLEDLNGEKPCQHLGFEFLAFRTMRRQISIALSNSISGTLLGQH